MLNEITFGKWKAAKTDAMNYRLYELKEIEKGERAGEVGYVGLPNYFATVLDAVRFARDREFNSGGYSGYLDGAIDEMRKLDKRFVSAVKKALDEC